MRRALLLPLLLAGCDASPPLAGDVDRGATWAVQQTIDAYTSAIRRHDRELYESTVSRDVAVVNDSGTCVPWLHEQFWTGAGPVACGTALRNVELTIYATQSRGDRVMLGAVVECIYDPEGEGEASVGLPVVFTLYRAGDGFEIARCHLLWPDEPARTER